MNLEEVKQALEWIDRGQAAGEDRWSIGSQSSILAAARAYVDLMEGAELPPRAWYVLSAVSAFGCPDGSKALVAELEKAGVRLVPVSEEEK